MSPPSVTGGVAKKCDTTPKLPAIDLALALTNVGSGAVGYVLLTREEQMSYRVVALAAAMTANATAIVIHSASAGKGFQWAKRCRALQAASAGSTPTP